MSKREYSYSEISLSIQSEGHYSGVPTVWINLWGGNKETPVDIAKRIRNLLPSNSFKHQDSMEDIHIAFAGEEPLLEQAMIINVIKQFELEKDYPHFITIETNGTQLLQPTFIQYFSKDYKCITLFFSISPELHVSKEEWKVAIKPAVVEVYRKVSDAGQLKYVVNNTQRTWDEVSRATELYQEHGVDFPVHIIPVEGIKEEDKKEIADECLRQGYNFSPSLNAREQYEIK